MQLVFGIDGSVSAWVASQIPHMKGGSFGPCAALGVVSNTGEPVGGVVFTDHIPAYGNIQVSLAATSRRWLTRNRITAILRYPFRQLGVKRLTALVPPSATNATQFLERMGWVREGCVRLGYGDEDAIIWGLLESEWRFNRFNADRQVQPKRRRRRRRGTLHIPEASPLH